MFSFASTSENLVMLFTWFLVSESHIDIIQQTDCKGCIQVSVFISLFIQYSHTLFMCCTIFHRWTNLSCSTYGTVLIIMIFSIQQSCITIDSDIWTQTQYDPFLRCLKRSQLILFKAVCMFICLCAYLIHWLRRNCKSCLACPF